MRGRKPREIVIAAADRPVLEQIARCRHLPWFQVERARVVLALAAGERTECLAARLGYDRRTIYRIGCRYTRGGVERLLSDAPKSGSPLVISPGSACTDRRTGLPGTHRRRASSDALEQRGSGTASRL